jgi:ABC-type molybdate transport system substrate-binding protein
MRKRLGAAVAAAVLAALFANAGVRGADPAPGGDAAALQQIKPDKAEDLKVFYPDGRVVEGEAALALMATGKTGLNLWLAGNQFFAMPDVLAAFQRTDPKVVGLITLPPGDVMSALRKGGWSFRGESYRFVPDVVGHVEVAPLKPLAASGMADGYVTYMHNKLVLMVAQGNPKGIKGVQDLGRDDLQIRLPNPLTEGITRTYAKPMLVAHGLWGKVSGGKPDCKECFVAPNVWFTTVHHREIPDGIKAGKTDVGIVWATEYLNARKQGIAIDMVAIDKAASMEDEVVYVAAAITTAPHAALGRHFVEWLLSDAAQAAYAGWGFIGASPAERAKGMVALR